MAGTSENTPFLSRSDTDYEYEESHPIKKLPANEYFKRAIKILSIISSILSIAVGGLLIATYVMLQVESWDGYTWGKDEATRDLAIVCITTAIVTLPTIFLQLPIIVTLAVNFTMSVVLFVFSGEMFSTGWPDERFCRRWETSPIPDYPYSRGKLLPATKECLKALDRITIFVGVDAVFGVVIGLLLMILVLLRLVAIFKTKIWEGMNLKGVKGWNSSGFEVSFSLKFVKVPTPGASPVAEAGREEESRLIET